VSKRWRIIAVAVLIALALDLVHVSFWGNRHAQPFGPGDSQRTVGVAGLTRTYRIHIPKTYDPNKPTPVILAFHGATDNVDFLEAHCQLNQKSEIAGFIVVYPESADPSSPDTLHFNTGSPPNGIDYPDDVTFTSKLLDDLGTVVNVDKNRVFATGISNGGMMCYRLAAELSDRIAAIAPIAATMGLPEAHPKRPVSIIAFHGAADPIIPFESPDPSEEPSDAPTIRSAMETIELWTAIDGCPADPRTERLPTTVHDATSVTRNTYGPGKDNAEIILYIIRNGGHTWPGTPGYKASLGLSSQNVSANDQMWEFFEAHPMPSTK
jgi:polyhydroxybutyrate depolymerase